MKRLAFFIYLAVVFTGLTACVQSPDCFNANIFCAGLVTDTLGLEDHGLTQDAWVGLQTAEQSGSVDHIAYIESIDKLDYEKNIAYFALKGYDVIITSGIGLENETLHAADLYPDSVFVGINQSYKEFRPNLIPINFAEDQMGFAAGVLAARLSKTNVVGAVCETSEIDTMWRYCEGFRAGAKYANPEIKILVAYRDEGDSEKIFVDEAWGYETANKLIFRGADVIFAAGGVTGQGALRAATESNILAIGAERDQAAVLAESGKGVVASIFGRSSFEVQEVMRLLREGNVSQGRLGQIKIVSFNEKYPESLRDELNILLLSLISGDEIKTNVTNKKP